MRRLIKVIVPGLFAAAALALALNAGAQTPPPPGHSERGKAAYMAKGDSDG